MPVFTVFTPTYNRAHLLKRVYKSLLKQSFKDFEWLIIDDGSTDNTKNVISSLSRENKINIRYYYQENKHKKGAFNKGVNLAKGMFFLPLDSDDELLPDSLETLYYYWNNIPENERYRYSGVCGLCMDDRGHIIGNKFPKDVFVSDAREIFYKYRIKGEKFGFTLTSILKKFPFPENFEGHIPEGIVWFKIARYYKTLFINRVVRIYHSEEQSIMNKPDPSKNAYGHILWFYDMLENDIEYFSCKPLWFIRCAINFNRFYFHLKKKNVSLKFEFNNKFSLFLQKIFKPFGYLLYIKDKL